MSKVLRVVVLCPNGRRETINITPNSSILQILEDACCRQKLNPDDYDVCHHNKPLDLTLPVRFASLPNNAQLELKTVKNARQDNRVTIALQLESGQRIMKDFQPSVSVWEVVEQSLDSKSLEDYKNKGVLVCLYMRQKLIGEEIKNTTLRSLGLTKGSAIIRLSHENQETSEQNPTLSTVFTASTSTNQTKVEQTELKFENPVTSASDKMTESCKMDCDTPSEINDSKTMCDAETMHISDNAQGTSVSTTNVTETYNSEKVDMDMIKSSQKEKLRPFSGKGMSLRGEVTDSNQVSSKESVDNGVTLDTDECTKENEEEMGTFHYIGGRHAVVYSLDDITEVKKADLPDEFFELTFEDIKYLMEQYKNERLELENRPLLTKELRNRQLLKRLGRYKQTVIRVNFPERLVLQAVFDSSETVQDVLDFVREYLEDKSLDFYLYTAPPKEKKDLSKSLIESMLIPAAVVYFGCNQPLPMYLSRTLKDKISDPRAAAVAAHESRQQAISCDPEDLSEETEDLLSDNLTEYKVPGPNLVETAKKPQTSEKVPKWLKLSKK